MGADGTPGGTPGRVGPWRHTRCPGDLLVYVGDEGVTRRETPRTVPCRSLEPAPARNLPAYVLQRHRTHGFLGP